MQRTPPTSQNMPSDSVDSDIPTASETEKPAAMHKGYKRRRVADGNIDSLSTLKKDLTELIDAKFKTLEDHIMEVKNHNADVCKTMEFIMTKYEEIKVEVTTMAQEREENRKYIRELEQKLEAEEKSSKATCVELRNVPKKETENKADLLQMAANLGTSLGLDLKKNEINDIYRVNPRSGKNSIVLVKFTTVIRKEEVMKSAKKYNRDHSTKLNCHLLGVGPSTVPVYIAEHLTPKMRRLFFLARDFARSNSFAYCWCSHGRIFLRKKEGTAQIYIKDEKQLEELRTPKEPMLQATV